MVSKSLARAGQMLAALVVAFFCILPAANALWVGGNIDVHNNTDQVAHDFHIKGKIKSTTEPTLLLQIGYVDGTSFPGFTHTIDHAGGDLWDFEAKWWSLDVQPSQVGHFGLFFDATCRNVWVELDGWWTDAAGNRIGDWPIPGFEVPTHWWDPPSDQVFRLQGDAGEEQIQLQILQMDMILVDPPADGQGAEDLFGLLNVEGMGDIGPWFPVESARDVPLPPGPDSFFDVFVEVDLDRGMGPNELLLARTLVAWPEEPGGRWFFHAHQAHPALKPVEIDIKPGSCPNPFNVNSEGFVPVAIVGSADLDVTTVDPTTVTLEGIYAHHWGIDGDDPEEMDPTQPSGSDPEDCFDCFDADDPANFNCDTDNDGVDDAYCGDGIPDLVLHFPTLELAAVPGIADAGRDDCIKLTLKGQTYDGTPIEGADSVIIRSGKKPAPSKHNTLSTFWGDIKAK
jgi:hypothetical protein